MTTTETPATPPATQSADLDADGMARDVGLLGLLWASEGSIIGSGWLFGALTAATIAGPSAIIAWVIASGIVILLALVHAELGGLFAVTGGTSRFPHYAFGSFAGATFGWFAYIQAATVAPIEVLAAVEYLSSISWAKGLYNSGSGTLSGWGIVVAIALMFLFVVANLIGVRWLARANTSITTWKVLVPILTIVVLMLTHFHSSNFSAGGGFFVHGAAFKSILIAIPTGGIVFSLLGFEQAVQLGGESANPKRDLPRAVIGSILIGAVIYIMVQVAFIGALNPALLAHGSTWASLATAKSPMATELQRAPFYAVASVAGLAWLAFILRIDAIISPGGTGLIYLTSASRISFGLAKNGYIPTAFSTISRRKVPAFGVIITGLLGLLFLLPFPSWDKLVGVVTSASVLMYAGAPLALGALRLQKPELERPYRLPWGKVLSPLAFILANFIVYWSGWQTYSTLMLVMVIGFILIAVSYRFNPDRPVIDWGAAIWVIPYLVGMGFISYFGGFGTGGIFGGQYGLSTTVVGGNGGLPLYWDLLVLAVFSLGIYFVAIAKRLPTSKVDYYVREVYPQPLAA
jgi:amino acid transporter